MIFWPGFPAVCRFHAGEAMRTGPIFRRHQFAPLAQLAEATDLESVRWRFESVVEHQTLNARLAQR